MVGGGTAVALWIPWSDFEHTCLEVAVKYFSHYTPGTRRLLSLLVGWNLMIAWKLVVLDRNTWYHTRAIIRLMYIELWQSSQSGISLHRMRLCKQSEVDAWVDSQKDELEGRISVEKSYKRLPTADTASFAVDSQKRFGHSRASVRAQRRAVPSPCREAEVLSRVMSMEIQCG